MRVQLIHNPVAGPRDITDDLEQVIEFLKSQGWEVTLRRTQHAGDATTFAREAVQQRYDMAVAVGGDGTLGEVATGLAHSDCVLGVLPVGTGNVWAHVLGVPTWTLTERTALLDAARILAEGDVYDIDLGLANDRYFVLWTGIGLDAEIAQGIEPHREMRRSLGNWTYLVGGLAIALRLGGSRMTVTIDGQTLRQRILMLLVTNVPLYAAFKVAPQAQLDDGMLDVYLFKGNSILDALRFVFAMLLGKHQRDPQIESYRATRVLVRGPKTLPIQVDGDPVGTTPVTISVAPRALRVVAPRSVPGSLFQSGAISGGIEVSLAQRIAERLGYRKTRWNKERERLRQEIEQWFKTPPRNRR